jgi:hypothetical protein
MQGLLAIRGYKARGTQVRRVQIVRDETEYRSNAVDAIDNGSSVNRKATDFGA